MHKLLGALVASLLLVPSSHAQEVIYAQAMSTVTVRDLPDLAEPPQGEESMREIRHDRHRTNALGSWSIATSPRWDVTPAAASFAAPRVTTLFSSTSSLSVAPGDASGAVGRNAIFTATNDKIAVHSRAGDVLLTKYLYQFIQVDPIGGNLYYYDPRVAYDAAADRWIAIALENAQYLIIAVSQSGDPTGTWTKYKLHLNDAIGEIDFTRLALTRDHVMIATNDDTSTIILSIEKTNLYAQPFTLQLQSTRYGGYGVTPVTAEDSPTRYLVYLAGTSLVVTTLGSGGGAISGPGPSWGYPFPAPQLGSGTMLDTGYGDVEMAVLRNGKLYVVHCIGQDAPDRTSVVWWVVDPQARQRLGGGTLDDPTGATWYAYPSLAVNGKGSILIGFSTFSATQYPSAGYVTVNASGQVSSIGVIQSGNTAFNGTDRWGDYTTTVVDPLDDSAFWTVQLTADARAWKSWWAKIPVVTISKTRSVRH